METIEITNVFGTNNTIAYGKGRTVLIREGEISYGSYGSSPIFLCFDFYFMIIIALF